jgi:hypothetical protein
MKNYKIKIKQIMLSINEELMLDFLNTLGLNTESGDRLGITDVAQKLTEHPHSKDILNYMIKDGIGIYHPEQILKSHKRKSEFGGEGVLRTWFFPKDLNFWYYIETFREDSLFTIARARKSEILSNDEVLNKLQSISKLRGNQGWCAIDHNILTYYNDNDGDEGRRDIEWIIKK